VLQSSSKLNSLLEDKNVFFLYEGVLALFAKTAICPLFERIVDFACKLGVGIDNVLHGMLGFYIISVSVESHYNLYCYECG